MKKLKLANPTKKEEVLLGDSLRDKFRKDIITILIKKAWKLWDNVINEEPNWEDDAPRLYYNEHKLIPFIIHKNKNVKDEVCIYGIGYDIDNIFFVDDNDEWYELDEMTLDEICDAINNIEFNIKKHNTHMKKNITKANIKKVNEFERELSYEGFTFIIDKDDWEDAPNAICTELLTSEDMDWIAKKLSVDFVELIEVHDITDEEDLNECMWEVYEDVIVRCDAFYYEDLSDEDYARLLKPHTLDDVRELYEKTKKRN